MESARRDFLQKAFRLLSMINEWKVLQTQGRICTKLVVQTEGMRYQPPWLYHSFSVLYSILHQEEIKGFIYLLRLY